VVRQNTQQRRLNGERLIKELLVEVFLDIVNLRKRRKKSTTADLFFFLVLQNKIEAYRDYKIDKIEA